MSEGESVDVMSEECEFVVVSEEEESIDVVSEEIESVVVVFAEL